VGVVRRGLPEVDDLPKAALPAAITTSEWLGHRPGRFADIRGTARFLNGGEGLTMYLTEAGRRCHPGAASSTQRHAGRVQVDASNTFGIKSQWINPWCAVLGRRAWGIDGPDDVLDDGCQDAAAAWVFGHRQSDTFKRYRVFTG